ncbi:TetR/AcrR family transcriptional regulator [Amycolatopsis sp. EV170708-02-1]|uniref:TetR/AcrR family transcriptional regulator n=1 Tax=Amycolatopsis sp. EV170708-02-1 TaxID=2919322 RepID=UPI001F0BE543|nr:TetR/AcrR family transcriptional regulator [Amycolatopsis sp. EV170708-02-1]UMO99546.1 TetR/AcrR family transcriptional regulator [Amycolatopsis sp. EV170708-02-1]
MNTPSTKQRLIDGALETIRTSGITAVSARTVAAAAGTNQALIFYHFGSVEELIAQACVTATEGRVAHFRARFAEVTTLSELLDLGRVIHAEERAEGNMTVLAQALAGAQGGGRLAEATRQALDNWVREVQVALDRVLAGSPVLEFTETEGLAHAVSAGFLGLTLFESVNPEGSEQALAALEQLAVLVDVFEGLGPVATRAVRAKLRKTAKRS